QQLLTRTRGGAVAHSVAYDLPIRYKNQQNPEAKAAIARAASGLVPRGAVIGLCGGTTATAIADALMSRADIMEPSPEPSLTVVTNAINIAMQLAMRPQIKTVVTGGVVHARSYELVGSYVDAVLGSITLDLAFIGVNGVDPVVGPTSHDEREAAVNALMASRAAHPVLVADASKIDKRAFAAIGHRRLFPTIITDDAATPEQRQRLTDSGYDVIVA
ncbi:MAG TPA: DeoR/GlpR family DNA-binding transcription regulator, partial [Agromyces mariniharenae]|nr:DeoR/GlpR family DNA-binding transcription regulator [Agromyces mariniharenae]